MTTTANPDLDTTTPETLSILARALKASSEIDRPKHNGLTISLSGTLTLAARSLREMESAFHPDQIAGISANVDEYTEHYEDSIYNSQPLLRASTLELLHTHLSELKIAIEQKDSATIRRFFEIYRFD